MQINCVTSRRESIGVCRGSCNNRACAKRLHRDRLIVRGNGNRSSRTVKKGNSCWSSVRTCRILSFPMILNETSSVRFSTNVEEHIWRQLILPLFRNMSLFQSRKCHSYIYVCWWSTIADLNELRDVATLYFIVSVFYCCLAVAVLSGCLPCCYATPRGHSHFLSGPNDLIRTFHV